LTRYAKVRFPSALPQLDKEFDYSIPDGLELEFGQLVNVPFGPKKDNKIGIVVELSSDSEFSSKVSSIQSISCSIPLLTKSQLGLAVAVAQRQAGSVGELLSQILPKRLKRAEAAYAARNETFSGLEAKPLIESELLSHKRVFASFDYKVEPNGYPAWAKEIALLGAWQLGRGQSTLIVAPDYRAVEALEAAIDALGFSSYSIRHESSDTGSVRYTNYLRALDEVAIHYGVRSASFAPAKDLGLIVLIDDGDESHIEQSAPYWNSRDVLLQRQEIDNAAMLVTSYSPSAEMVRLVELGYFKKAELVQAKPMTRVTDNHTRLDDESFGFISSCLRAGKPVLIQTATLGQATGVACRNCRELRECPECSGRICIESSGRFRCRSCLFSGPIGACSCGGVDVSIIKLGSSGLAESLAKGFPEAQIVHSSGAEKITRVASGATLVIATNGAEPFVDGGYACVLIADAYSMVAGSRLRSLEQSALRWANAASLVSQQGLVIFVGLTGLIADQAKQFDFYSMIQADYTDRVELGLPPAQRLLSISSTSQADLNDLTAETLNSNVANYLRKLPASGNQIAFTYPYAQGNQVATTLIELSMKISNKSKFRKPGQRLFRISMDDASVL